MKFSLTALATIIIFSQTLSAQSAGQWRGENRNGFYPDTGLLDKWPDDGPELLWSTEEIGNGYSSPSINVRCIFITGIKDRTEYFTALDHNGKMLWQIPFGQAAKRTYPESRSTPTLDGDYAYVTTGSGELACIDLKNQNIKWSVNCTETFDGKFNEWEIAESPLVVDNKVLYTPAGEKTTMIALDKLTGETLWQSESLKDATAYVSPILIHRGGKKIAVNITARYVFGVNVDDGKLLWSDDYAKINTPKSFPGAENINCVTPLYHDGMLFITSGYDHTGVMYKIAEDGSSIEQAWVQPELDTHHGGVVFVDGYIYGSNWINNRMGNWVCLEWNTGKVMYIKQWETKGPIIAADGHLYVMDERRGNVALVPVSSANFNPVSSFRVTQGRGPYWAHPVINDGILYIRHGDFLMAYNIK